MDSGRYRGNIGVHPIKLIMNRILYLLIALATAWPLSAQIEARFGNEAADTLVLTRLLDQGSALAASSPEARTAFYARQFLGTPYAAHTLEGDEEVLTVRVDSLDCTTFVETALALAYTTGERRNSWRDFLYNLRRIRYRNGEVNGYPSRLHYIADWAVDNKHRGNINDVTNTFPKVNYVVRTLDFMSSHRKAYSALADSANYARIKSIENGYRNHKFPYIKTMDLGNKATKAAFHDGDVLAFVSNLKDLDVTHMGIVAKESPGAEPYVIHASQSHGKVEISATPLADFVKKNRSWIGVRVFRLME